MSSEKLRDNKELTFRYPYPKEISGQSTPSNRDDRVIKSASISDVMSLDD